MKYSINPFKWLAWLWRKWKWRNTVFSAFNTGHKPMNKKGKAELMRKLKEAHEKTEFKLPVRGPLGFTPEQRRGLIKWYTGPA